jgi:hypothetical protein
MEPGTDSHEWRTRAERVAQQLADHFGDALPEDVRTLVSYWRACELGAVRAARVVVLHASAFGIHEVTKQGAPR